MKTLSINFYAKNITEESKSELMTAVQHESCNMNIQLLDDTIAKLEKKIANENSNYSDEEVQAFQVQLDSANESRTKFVETQTDTLEVYNKVISTMSQKNADHFGNSADVVKTVLRVLGSWDNSKLVKYAIIPAFESPELYEALQASAELETIIKKTFSLPFETPYTGKTRVKLTAEDKKLLNDCYIKGFSNKFDVDDEKGTVSFKKRQINTLVKAKKNRKTGEITYDYSGLASTISNIVIKHYFA